jgi:prepilin-type N-terminal cleavage/methylation domain-containing protein
MEPTMIPGFCTKGDKLNVCRWRNGCCGFTLLEVLISTTILAFLVVILSQMLGGVGGVWQQGHAQVEKSEGGRAILEFMAKELQAAMLPVNRADQTSLQLVVNPSVSATYKNRDAIFWQAPLATDQSLGDIAEFGYFVKWDNSNAQNPKARLCRFFVNPGTNYIADANYLIDSNPNAWLGDAIINSVAPADNTNSDAPYQGLFVENVLALWITCLDPAGNTISQGANGTNAFDSRLGYTYTDVSGTSVALSGCALPAAIDVSFVLLDSNSANRITPPVRDAIMALSADSSIRNANEFVMAALKNSSFKAIQTGLRPCMTRVYLQNSK